MRVRYALQRGGCCWERKQHRRIRTADSMRVDSEPRIATPLYSDQSQPTNNRANTNRDAPNLVKSRTFLAMDDRPPLPAQPELALRPEPSRKDRFRLFDQ